MKSTILTLTLLACFVATLVTHSQTSVNENPFGTKNQEDNSPTTEVNEGPVMVRVQAEFIEMTQASYTKLMAKPRTSANDHDLRAECAKLIAREEARIIESMCITALPGQTATSESVSEYIYPTEYHPGEIPNTINGQPSPPNTPFASPPTPSAFDTKNTGSSLEAEIQISPDNQLIELRCTPTIVYHLDTINWGAEKVSGAAGPIKMPSFYVLTIKTGTNLVSGQPTMVAALTPKNEDGLHDPSFKVMVFFRADILNVGK